MNYWLYAQGDIKGPFSADDLVSRNGFRLTSLVCPEDKLGETGDDWKCASEYADLSAALECAEKTEPAAEAETVSAEADVEVSAQPETAEQEIAETQQPPKADAAADFSEDDTVLAQDAGDEASKTGSYDSVESEVPEAGQSVTAEAGTAEAAETLELLKSLGYSEREAQQLVHFDGAVLEDAEQDIDFVRPSPAEKTMPAAAAAVARPAGNKKSAGGLPRELGEVAPAWIAALKENELLQELAQDSSRFALDAAEPEEEEETAADYMATASPAHKKAKAARRAAVRYTDTEPQDDDLAEEPQDEQAEPARRSRPEALPPVRKAVSEMVRQAQADDEADTEEIEFPQEMVSPGLLDTEVYRPEDGEKTPRPAVADTPKEDGTTTSMEEVHPARNLSLSALAQDTIRKESSAEVAEGTLPPILMREDSSISAGPAPAEPASPTASVGPASSAAPTAEPATVPGGRQTADTGPFMGDIQARIAALSRTDKMNATAEPKTFPAVTAENSTDGKTQVPLPEALPGTLLADAFSKTSAPSFTQTPMMTSAPLPKPEPQPQQPSGFPKFQTQTQFPGGTVSGTVNDLRTVHVAAEVKNARLTVAGNTAQGAKSGGGKGSLKKVFLIILALLVVLGVMLTLFKMLGGKKGPPQEPPAQTDVQPDADSAVDTSSVETDTAAAVSPQDQNQPGPSVPPISPVAQQPAAQQPAADAAAKSELAVDIVRKYNLPGGKGTIENWFANTLVAGLGGEPYEEKWEGKSCYRNTCYVYYKLLQPRKEPIQYGFVVDTELKTIKSGINNKAVELLGGDDGMFSGKTPAASSTASQTYKPAQTGSARPAAAKKPAVKKKAAAPVRKKRASYGGASDQLPLPKDPNSGRKGARALIDDMSAEEKAHYDSMMEDEYKKRHDVTDY